MEGLTIDNNNNDNIPKALRKSIETSEKLQEKFSPILEQEKKMQQLVEGVNIPKFEVSTQALDAMRNITDNSAMRIAQDNMNVMKSRALQMSPKINAAIASANNNAFKSIGKLAIKSSLHNYQFDIPAIKILDDLGKNATANLISGLNTLVNNSAMREIQSITSRLGKWLQTIDFSPLTSILENIRAAGFDHDYREVNDVFLKAMFSQEMEQYKGYTISEIDPLRGTVTFTNGEVISTGDIVGDISEKDMRRIQIRETILSHFEKEEKLFDKGIKCLSLFFIDEVAKYRQYDENGDEVLGEYGKMFEQEYINVLNEYVTLLDTPYQRYLKSTCSDVEEVHKGYFSIDKKGHAIDSKVKRGSEFSDDISAYDLILKNKERLLSFDEPTRFIFSHSALREGWDNPNVFQICTLKHSDSNTAKRQEVGRGLRLCVNQNGNRMDVESCGETVHDINVLTVIASESYKTFVTDLQSDIKTVLYDRPTVATSEYFKGKYIKVDDVPTLIDDETANAIEFYLIQNGYVDMKRKVTDKYRQEIKSGTVAELPDELKPMAEGIHTLIQSVYDDSILQDMFTDGHETKVKDNPLNDNFAKKEFQALWREINHKYAYTVEFDSDELIKKAIAHIDEKLFVSELQYTTTIGRQKAEMNEYEVERGASFTGEKTRTQTLKHAETSRIKYDLIGKVAEGTTLTRKTVSAILQGIRADKLYMFKNNPEEFITKVIRLINEQKATMIVEHISYDTIEGEYDSTIFTAEKNTQSFDKAFLAKKAIQDYVFTDGSAEKSIERKFAEDLDAAAEVCVYAKLPRTFQIPTPVGNYSPDWAIAFYEGTVKHIFFVAETKGTMETLNLRPIEQAKISCAKKLFNEMSNSKVVYHDVDSYQSLLNIMNDPSLDKKVCE